MAHSLIVVAGYLVRFPLGGYAWQAAHYLLGLRALGHDVWFYEDTGYYAPAFNPLLNGFSTTYDYGVSAAGSFLDCLGLGDRWVFVDMEHGTEYGPGAGRARALIRDADLVLNLGLLNRQSIEQRSGQAAAYIDLDPVYTQIKALNGDKCLQAALDEHRCLFTLGENIGTARCAAPTGGYTWHSTRQPVVLDLWPESDAPGTAYTTIGQWNSQGRDLVYDGQVWQWSKRAEWLRCLDLPARVGVDFEMAMNVESIPGDTEILRAHGWHIIDPLAISTDPWRYREYISGSRAEFTVAKDMNVRLRSGWFSDRAACYLATGRPVIEQNTGFGDILPLGPGLHAFGTVEEAAVAVEEIEADYGRARKYARELAQEYFAAGKVLARLLKDVGL